MKLKYTIQEIFDQEGVEYKISSSSLMISCHLCSGDKKKRAVRKTNGGNKCYRCGDYMGITELLKVLFNYSLDDISNKYGLRANVSQAVESQFDELLSNIRDLFSEKDDEPKIEEDLPTVLLDALFIPIEESIEGMDYLIKRGIKSPKIWIDYDVHFNKMLGGPVFPIKMNGRIVGYQCRKINPMGGPRMYSMPGPWKSKSLLNYDNACLSEEIGLFEGPFDALSAEMAGLVSVATLGKIVSKRQIELLKECGAKRIYIGFDPDAYLEVRELCKKLCGHKEVYRLTVPDGKDDFGDCTPEEIRTAIENAEECYAEKTGSIKLYIN